MALWQFVFDLIPSSAATINGVVAARMNRDQLDAIELNFSRPNVEAIFEHVGMMLPEKQSWAPDLRIWGDEKTDDVQIYLRGATIEGVQFRLNVPDLSLPLVGKICALAREFDCVLATRNGAIIRPNSQTLVRAITQSGAARFVSDPERYLREVIQWDAEPE
ncbi:hypothetical protein ACQZ6C_08360 [Rhizobium rhizogenes]